MGCRICVTLACAIAVSGCQRAAEPEPAPPAAAHAATLAMLANAPVYLCPMDKDIRSHKPGSCPRCGMKLVTSVPDPVEYHLELAVSPTPAPNAPVDVRFDVFDPWKENRVTKYNLVHEKLFHAFAVSRDLEFFTHGHPVWNGSSFDWAVTFPKPGMYRILADFYPEASAPQLLTKTVFVAGDEPPVHPLARDYDPKTGDNVRVQMETQPEHPVAGAPVRVRLVVSPGDGLQKYLGVWAHMLAASDDLIDLMHTHPSIADGSTEMQFDMLFPRPRVYRLWVQLQRLGVVNTVHFDVPVSADTAPPVASLQRSSGSRVGHRAG
jgi:Heavy metal binding domain